MSHTCTPRHPNGLFCKDCGKVLDKDALKRVGILPRFTGPASMSKQVEAMYETGRPPQKKTSPAYNPAIDG